MANAPVPMTIGHVDNMSLEYLDTDGNPMLVTPVPDAPPTWVDNSATPGAATLVVAASGLTATETAVAAGTSTGTMTFTVGGVAFTDTWTLTITAAVQQLGAVKIVHNVV